MFPPLFARRSFLATRIDRVVTTGTCTLHGQTRQCQNNVWLLGDDQEALVIDAAHDTDAIRAAIGARQVGAVACTHAHADHINVALTLSTAVGAPVLLHPDDDELWDVTHPDRRPDGDLVPGEILRVASLEIRVLDTSGHTPGSVSLYVAALQTVFTGDALVAGAPCATGRSPDDIATPVGLIREQLLSLPPQTRVLPGHGSATTVRAQVSQLEARLSPTNRI